MVKVDQKVFVARFFSKFHVFLEPTIYFSPYKQKKVAMQWHAAHAFSCHCMATFFIYSPPADPFNFVEN